MWAILLLPLVSALHGHLYMRYPHGRWINPGDTLPIDGNPYKTKSFEDTLTIRAETKPVPILQTTLPCTTPYLLLTIDPDVQYGTTSTVVLHWLQSLQANCLTGLLYENSRIEKKAEYIPPQPPKRSHHRYVFLLFAQPDNYHLPECYEHILPATKEARVGFDPKRFIEVMGLGSPVAGNWFYVENGGEPVVSDVVPTTTSLRAVCTHLSARNEL